MTRANPDERVIITPLTPCTLAARLTRCFNKRRYVRESQYRSAAHRITERALTWMLHASSESSSRRTVHRTSCAREEMLGLRNRSIFMALGSPSQSSKAPLVWERSTGCRVCCQRRGGKRDVALYDRENDPLFSSLPPSLLSTLPPSIPPSVMYQQLHLYRASTQCVHITTRATVGYGFRLKLILY